MEKTIGLTRTCLLPVLILMFGLSVCANAQAGTGEWLVQAHSHNDYRHSRPLLDALDRGFCSVEADIFLVNGQLLVAHDEDEIAPQRTLAALYLDPLAARLRGEPGSQRVPACRMTLLIDVKSEAKPAWRALSSLLDKYRDILTAFEGEEVRPGPLTVIVSGNRAASLMLKENLRYAGLDGRLADVDLGLSPALMPLLSEDWSRYFKWAGEGQIPPKERDQLNYMVKKAQARGYRVRFWASPDNPAGWKVLKDVRVDYINTDDLDGLRRFLSESRVDD